MRDTDAHRFLSGKHLVIFGAGYIGGAVARLALKANCEVTILTRNEQTAASLSAAGCEVVVAHLESSEWHRQIGKADFVLNSVSAGGRGLAGYRQSYLLGSQSILQWGIKTDSTARLVYTGSTSVYPKSEIFEIDESAAIAGSDERSQILVDTEQSISRWPADSRILRLAGIYGPDRHYLLDQLRAGETTLPGSGDHHLNLIHRDDAVGAVISAWTDSNSEAQRVFNVVDDGRARKREIVAWLAEQLQREPPHFTGEVAPGRRASRPDRILVNRRIKDELDWQPIYQSFRQGYAAILGA